MKQKLLSFFFRHLRKPAWKFLAAMQRVHGYAKAPSPYIRSPIARLYADKIEMYWSYIACVYLLTLSGVFLLWAVKNIS